MGLFDWLFGSSECCEGDERLKVAVERVIVAIDPRLKAVGNVRQRLAPAVARALDDAQKICDAVPPVVTMSPDTWAQVPIVRAMFTHPSDVATMLSNSEDLRDFLGSPAAAGQDTIYCLAVATRVERTVLGSAIEGEVVRRDIAQTSVGFKDLRLIGFSLSEQLLAGRILSIVLEGLVLAALRGIADIEQRGKHLDEQRRLMLTRLRLMEQADASLNALAGNHLERSGNIGDLHRQLTQNDRDLAALKSGSRVDAILASVIEALNNGEALLQARRISLRLNLMNILVGDEVANALPVELIEFSIPKPERPRRVAFPVSIPRRSVVERHIDFDAVLRTL